MVAISPALALGFKVFMRQQKMCDIFYFISLQLREDVWYVGIPNNVRFSHLDRKFSSIDAEEECAIVISGKDWKSEARVGGLIAHLRGKYIAYNEVL